MKVRILFVAAASIFLLLSCKKETSTTSANSTTTESHNHDAAAHDSELMESMNNMMEQMHAIEMSGNADHDLAAMMEEHHKSAVGMADILLDKGTDPGLKNLANKIKSEQDAEIAEMQKIQGKYKDAAKNYDPKNTKDGLGKAMMDDMMTMMKMPENNKPTVDAEFAVIMTKHHQDGIKMAQSIVKYARDPAFKAMAEKMIASQTADVKVMEDWLAAHK